MVELKLSGVESMVKKSLISLIVATALVGCGGDKDELDGNSRGSIEITSGELIAGTTLTASVTDVDGIKNDTLVYAWSTGASGTSYTITEADEGTIISVSARYTDEAGITEGVGASTSIILPTLDVTANVVKGPVSGASCELFAVNSSGAAVTPAQGSAMSGESGSVTFANVHFEGAGLVSCSGGTYTDESTGATLNAPMLRAVLTVVEGDAETPAPSYVVSPLTEMAVQAAGADLNTFAAKAAIINARFGIRFDATQVLPTEVGVVALGTSGAENADRYGSALALLSQLDADNAGKDMTALIADIATDVADGSFSAANLTAFETAQTNLQTTSAVAGDVDGDLLNLIGSAIGYNNTPVAAIIEGTLSGTVKNTATTPLMGTVTVVDPNFEEDAILVQSNVALNYGTFNISAQGAWSYTVDVNNESVANLELGNSVYDTVTITSIDGTTESIEVRVAALTQVVKLSDPGSDTGEIKFSVNNLRKGKLTATFLKDETLGSDGNVKDAYITLYGNNGSSANALIDLRIQGNQTDSLGNAIAPRFLVRNTEAAAYPGDMVTAPFVEGEFYDIEISWDMDQTEQLTLTINGEVVGGGSFVTSATGDYFADGVQTIQFRFSDNDRTVPFGAFFVDNIAVYSDVAGTVSVFADDFENYSEGETLDGAGSLYSPAIYAEVVVYDSGDGTVEPTPAAFFNLTASLPSDQTTALTGTVSVIDPDEGEASIAPASFATTWGDFSIQEDGNWTYTLDTTNATIAALVQGESETDTISIMSYDGTMADLVITVSGAKVVATGANNVARMADTTTDADAELRLTTAALAEGSISATIKLQAISGFTATEGVDEDNTAYISVYGGSASSNNLTGEIVFSNGAVKYRDAAKEQQTIDGLTYADDTDIDVVIDWTATGYSVSIDGGATFYGPYVAINTGTATETYQIRIGSSSKVSAKELLVDDIVIADAIDSAILSEDFEIYADSEDLSTTYSSSAEATVRTLAGTSTNNVARMADTTTDADAELRLTTAALTEGSISATIKLQAISGFTATEGVDEDNTTYISIYGGSASSNNLTGEIVFSNGAVKYRDAAKDQQTIDGLTYADDTDIDVVIDWTATGYSLSIDGGTTFYGPYVAINTGAATETYQIRIGSSSKVSAKELIVDDIVIADAADSAILSEDFEIYADGEDLSTTYSSSAEATVRTLGGTSSDLVARIVDTTTDADGELRLTTAALAEGSISATIKLQAISGFTATPGVDEDNTAYISVYGGSASSNNLTGEIVFSNGAVKYRDAAKSQQTIEGLTYADDADIDVVIDWTATGYSLSIDGGTTFYGPYVAINTGTATETYQIRIGSSSKESAKELIVDDIVIADATDSTILSEDFETGYAVGDDLSTTYSDSAEATVQED
jgi:VCBS repeat-containing protein